MKITKNINKWLKDGERGASSETIISFLTGINIIKHYRHPSDPFDFDKCYKLVQRCPEIKSRLHMMKKISSVWGKIIDNWDTLVAMLLIARKQERKTGVHDDKMYRFMKSLGC